MDTSETTSGVATSLADFDESAADQIADNENPLKVPKSGGPRAEYNQAYLVEVAETTTEYSEGGERWQSKLRTKIVAADGALKSGPAIWVDVPDAGNYDGLSAEKAAEVELRTNQRFASMLRAMKPKLFAAYASVDKTTKPWTFTGHDGQTLTDEDREAASKVIEKRLAGVATKLKANEMTLNGLRAYVVFKPNKDEQYAAEFKYPYVDFYGETPEKAPLAAICAGN